MECHVGGVAGREHFAPGVNIEGLCHLRFGEDVIGGAVRQRPPSFQKKDLVKIHA